MTGSGLRLCGVLLLGVFLAAACGSSDRPEELPLDEARPCDLILDERLEALQVTNGPILSDDAGGYGLEGTRCKYYVVYRNENSGAVTESADNAVNISVVTNHGVDWQIDDTVDSEHFDYKDVSRVQGYRAIRVWSAGESPGANTPCELYVDVADEQMLRLAVGTSYGEVDPPTCETARGFAKEAVKTLRIRHE